MMIFSIRVYVPSIIVIVTCHEGEPDVGVGKC